MSKKSFIDSVEVKTPCTEEWDQMTGTNKIRFCSHCAKDVNNISEMTRKEAMNLIRASNGNICVRYYRDPRTDRPFFMKPLHQIASRSPGIAAGVMTASIALSAHSFAQTTDTKDQPQAPNVERVAKTSPNVASSDGIRGQMSGTIVDPNGAVIAGAIVEVTNVATGEKFTRSTNDEGRYSFENVPDGEYTIKSSANGFVARLIEHVAITNGNADDRVTELRIGAVVTMGVMVSSYRIEYKNPLTLAVQDEDIDLVRDLIARGAKVRGKEDDGTTPIAAAVGTGNLELVQLLLNAGARVNVADKSKETPLMRLSENAPAELATTLINAGAKLNVRDDDGNTPLLRVVREVKPEVLKVLIDAGSDVNAKNDDGETALMIAADEDDLEKVRMLILAGADVNAKDKEGETAWDKTSDSDVEDLLVSFGAIVETPEPSSADNDPKDKS